jgi:hypothetical protein
MNRKLLNEARKAMSPKKFLRRIYESDKSFRPNVNLSNKTSRSNRQSSDKECINKSKSLSK